MIIIFLKKFMLNNLIHRTKRGFSWVLMILFLALLIPTTHAEVAENGPNIIVINNDLMQYRRTFSWSFNESDFYRIDLSGYTNYTLLNIPMWWSFENITNLNTNLLLKNNLVCEKIIVDANEKIQLINVNSSDTYRVLWSSDSSNRFIGWKDDCFTYDWPSPKDKEIFSTDGDIATIGYDNLKGQGTTWKTFKRSLSSFITIQDYPLCKIKYKLHSALPEGSISDNYWRIIFYDTEGNEWLSDQYYLKDYEWHTLTIDLRQRPTITNISSIVILIRTGQGSLLSVAFDYIMLVQPMLSGTRIVFEDFETGLSTAWEENLSPQEGNVDQFELVNNTVFHGNNAIKISYPSSVTLGSASLIRELPSIVGIDFAVNKVNSYNRNSSEFSIFLTDGKKTIFYILTDKIDDPIRSGNESIRTLRLPCSPNRWTVFLLKPIEEFRKYYSYAPSYIKIGFQTYSDGNGNPKLIVDDIYVYPMPLKSLRELILDSINYLSPLITLIYLLVAFIIFLKIWR